MKSELSPSIPARAREDGSGQPVITEKEVEQSINDLGYEITEEGREGFDKAFNNKIRRLTPLECERLQGFPDNWTKGFADTNRYKMMGNAVTVNVIEAIIKKLAEMF